MPALERAFCFLEPYAYLARTEKLHEDFETDYARHAKRYLGLDGTVEEIAELVKKDRNGPHYRNEKCDYA